jgi:hypothetical protein
LITQQLTDLADIAHRHEHPRAHARADLAAERHDAAAGELDRHLAADLTGGASAQAQHAVAELRQIEPEQLGGILESDHTAGRGPQAG